MHQVTKPRGRHAVPVEPTGRRRRFARYVGVAAACLLTAYLAVVAFGLVTGSSAPLTFWQDAKPAPADAAPGGDTPQLRPRSSPPAGKRPTVSTSPDGTTFGTRGTPAASHTPTASATPRPGRGRAHGLTKGPHARKP